MTIRVRHCVQCPTCLTYYLVGFSPYGNGSYLQAAVAYVSDECTLYCSCRTPAVASRWRGVDAVACEVSREAHQRGYGSAADISPIRERRDAWVIEVSKYLNPRLSEKGKDAG